MKYAKRKKENLSHSSWQKFVMVEGINYGNVERRMGMKEESTNYSINEWKGRGYILDKLRKKVGMRLKKERGSSD